MSDAGAGRRSRQSCERIGAHRERVLKGWRPWRRSQQSLPTCRQEPFEIVSVELPAENGIWCGGTDPIVHGRLAELFPSCALYNISNLTPPRSPVLAPRPHCLKICFAQDPNFTTSKFYNVLAPHFPVSFGCAKGMAEATVMWRSCLRVPILRYT